MKINDVRALQTPETAAAGKAPGTTAPVKTTHATPAIGSVQISEASRSLQLSGTSNSEAPFDVKRVEAIKSAISSGQFKVNPEAVASKVIDSASQLLVGASA